MSFDWQAFLDQRGIEYSTKGASRGNLMVHCPFCGDADQGKHMGISIEGKGFGCWRNQAHRGKAPQRLVQALLGCSWGEAAKIVGKRLGGAFWGAGDALGTMLAGFQKADATKAFALKLPINFGPMTVRSRARPFYEYMEDRGYSDKHIKLLAHEFNLRYAMTGDYSYRIIIPIHDEEGELVTWTGRAINDDPKIRYKTLSEKPENVKAGNPIANGPITDYLFDMPNLWEGGKFLVITEGPFDALRLALGARNWGARVTCLFGKAVSDSQLDYLADLSELYDAMFLMLDPEANADELALTQQLAGVGVVPALLQGASDPGAFTNDEMKRAFDGMAEAAAKRIRPFANSGRLP